MFAKLTKNQNDARNAANPSFPAITSKKYTPKKKSILRTYFPIPMTYLKKI
tara:strand:- start:8121 stop:8273 length:153 start_codon:yes stop_codon:yes gene_type:complete